MLSEYFGFSFDNPRTTEELKYVKAAFTTAWENRSICYDSFHYLLPEKEFLRRKGFVYYKPLTMEHFIECLFPLIVRKDVSQLDKVQLCMEGDEEAFIDLVAKNWIIGQFSEHTLGKAKSKLTGHLSLESDRNGIEMVSDHCSLARRWFSSYMAFLLPLKTKDDCCFYGAFLPNGFGIGGDQNASNMMAFLTESAKKVIDNKDNMNSIDLLTGISKHKLKKLDFLLANDIIKEDLVLYIGEIFDFTNNTKNEHVRLLNLTSIIEMLITHQPNFMRYNIEDSITKQFILKMAVLIHKVIPNINLNTLKQKLKAIYTIRSHIVHGNFSKLVLYRKELAKKNEFFDSLVDDCAKYVKILLDESIKNPDFVKFLKDN